MPKPLDDDSSDSEYITQDEDPTALASPKATRQSDFYDEDEPFGSSADNGNSDRVEMFGPMLNGSQSPDITKRDQITNVKRQLSYSMASLGQRATGWWDSIRGNEADRTAELKLLERLDEITSNSFIGHSTDKLINTAMPGSPLGFQIGSASHLRGARISSVTEGSPASVAGLEVGDVIVAIQGKNALGMGHADIIDMVKSSNDVGTKVTITVASPVEAKIPSDTQRGHKNSRPKPPSYVIIRNKLVEEFGEDVYNRCKKKVQIYMEELAAKYDAMAGIEPPPPPSLSEELKKKVAIGREIAIEKFTNVRSSVSSVKSSVKSWVSSVNNKLVANPDAAREKEDEESLIAARADAEEDKLHVLLTNILMAWAPLEECPDAFLPARSGDKGMPGLSYSGVRLYLINETSEACFNRNKAFIQGKLQERELLRLSYGTNGSSAAEVAQNIEGAEMLVSV